MFEQTEPTEWQLIRGSVKDLGIAIKDFPGFLLRAILGLITVVLTEPPVMLLCAAAGIATMVLNVWVVIFVATVIYVILHAITSSLNAVASAINRAGSTNIEVAKAVIRHSAVIDKVFSSPPTQPPLEVMPLTNGPPPAA